MYGLIGRILADRLLAPGSSVTLGDNIMRVAEAEFERDVAATMRIILGGRGFSHPSAHQFVEEGTIVAARPITIEGSQQSAKIGTLAGAALGAVLVNFAPGVTAGAPRRIRRRRRVPS